MKNRGFNVSFVCFLRKKSHELEYYFWSIFSHSIRQLGINNHINWNFVRNLLSNLGYAVCWSIRESVIKLSHKLLLLKNEIFPDSFLLLLYNKKEEFSKVSAIINLMGDRFSINFLEFTFTKPLVLRVRLLSVVFIMIL